MVAVVMVVMQEVSQEFPKIPERDRDCVAHHGSLRFIPRVIMFLSAVMRPGKLQTIEDKLICSLIHLRSSVKAVALRKVLLVLSEVLIKSWAMKMEVESRK